MVLSIGLAVALPPVAGLIPAIPLLVTLLLLRAEARAAFIVLGGLAVLQSSQQLSLAKVGYLAGAVLALAGAVNHLLQTRSILQPSAVRRLLVASVIAAVVFLMSFFVAAVNGTGVIQWLRDVTSYLLVVTVPVFALDVATSPRIRFLTGLLLLAGLLSAVSFSVEWAQRHGISNLAISRIVLPSFFLPIALFAYASGSALVTRSRSLLLFWASVAVVILALFIVTGTRSVLVVAVGLVAMVAFAKGRGLPRLVTLLFACGAVLAIGYVGLQLIGLGHGETTRLAARFASFVALLTNPLKDGSFEIRYQQSQIAWFAFLSSPVFGIGPGHIYHWTAFSSHRPLSGPSMDTSMLLLAKFGIVGVAVATLLSLAWIGLIRDLRRPAVTSIPLTALVGYGVVVVSWMIVVSPPFEDKGVSLGLLILAALAIVDARSDAAPDQPERITKPVDGLTLG